jgi:hypothetical protein
MIIGLRGEEGPSGFKAEALTAAKTKEAFKAAEDWPSKGLEARRLWYEEIALCGRRRGEPNWLLLC